MAWHKARLSESDNERFLGREGDKHVPGSRGKRAVIASDGGKLSIDNLGIMTNLGALQNPQMETEEKMWLRETARSWAVLKRLRETSWKYRTQCQWTGVQTGSHGNQSICIHCSIRHTQPRLSIASCLHLHLLTASRLIFAGWISQMKSSVIICCLATSPTQKCHWWHRTWNRKTGWSPKPGRRWKRLIWVTTSLVNWMRWYSADLSAT